MSPKTIESLRAYWSMAKFMLLCAAIVSMVYLIAKEIR
jgi:hypothetical protein